MNDTTNLYSICRNDPKGHSYEFNPILPGGGSKVPALFLARDY